MVETVIKSKGEKELECVIREMWDGQRVGIGTTWDRGRFLVRGMGFKVPPTKSFHGSMDYREQIV